MIIFEIQRKYKAVWFMVYYVGPIHICACSPYFRKSRIDNYTVDNYLSSGFDWAIIDKYRRGKQI